MCTNNETNTVFKHAKCNKNQHRNRNWNNIMKIPNHVQTWLGFHAQTAFNVKTTTHMLGNMNSLTRLMSIHVSSMSKHQSSRPDWSCLQACPDSSASTYSLELLMSRHHSYRMIMFVDMSGHHKEHVLMSGHLLLYVSSWSNLHHLHL